MKKNSTIFWLLTTVALIAIGDWLMPHTSLTIALLILIAIVGGILALIGGGEQRPKSDLPINGE